MDKITTIDHDVRAKSQSDSAPETGNPALRQIENQKIHPYPGENELDKKYQIHAD